MALIVYLKTQQRQRSHCNGTQLSRKDRNPCPRPTLPSLIRQCVSVCRPSILGWSRHKDLPSSFSSFFASSAGASPAAAAPPVAPEGAAAAAPPPDPTFNNMSLTFLPSSAYFIISVVPSPPTLGFAVDCENAVPLRRESSIWVLHRRVLQL